MKRGDSACLVRDDGEVCVVKWKDNKSVLLMSSAVGCEPVATCMRWCIEAKKKVPVPQPAIVAHYNKFMGGLDLVNRYVSYYQINIKTRKWKEVLSQLQFKQDIAETLIRENPMHNRKERSDPPATDNSRPVQLPNLDTRRDRFDHFPEFCSLKNAMRCRNENCKGKTRVKCTKCNVFLCLQGKNCFVKFHNAGN
ncbi:hypothetical protein MRX96_030163 [Rhipicephalus microplus]